MTTALRVSLNKLKIAEGGGREGVKLLIRILQNIHEAFSDVHVQRLG